MRVCDARRSYRPAADSSWCSLAAIGPSQASCAGREWISPDGRQSNRVRPWLFDLLRSSGLPTHVVGGTAMACSVGRPRLHGRERRRGEVLGGISATDDRLHADRSLGVAEQREHPLVLYVAPVAEIVGRP